MTTWLWPKATFSDMRISSGFCNSTRALIMVFLAAMFLAAPLMAQTKRRARELGIPFNGKPGKPNNAITDVAGVTVGFETLCSDKEDPKTGRVSVRTGVTAIVPRHDKSDPVFAGWYSLNGSGEMTGTTWIEESGFLEGPIMITSTYSVGVVRDAVIAWQYEHDYFYPETGAVYWGLPVVAETYDGALNDIKGLHVEQTHVFAALDNAGSGTVTEGNVGGGTGMICHEFKGGTGTASRKLDKKSGGYTVGVLVQSNYGCRDTFTVAGVPVGKEIRNCKPEFKSAHESDCDNGSIIVVVATDAPLLPHQLERLARRVPLGIAKAGGLGANLSGDIFIAFSTANPGAANDKENVKLEMMPNDKMTPLFAATVQATEEAILNALVAAETMTGKDGNTVHALPHGRLQEVLKKYNRLKM